VDFRHGGHRGNTEGLFAPLTQKIDCGFRLDILVADAVVVEVKSVERLHSIHESQLFTYLKVSGHRVGLLLNFNVSHMRHGITRRIL
jgi:GxxExxY protein